MIFHSIRWRLQLWLACLLGCVLIGFGVVVHQLQRIAQHDRVKKELEVRIDALDTALRGSARPPPDGGPPMAGGPNRGRPPGPGPYRMGARELVWTPDMASLFDTSRSNAFYYAVWDRDGIALQTSSNAPVDMVCPDAEGAGRRIHMRTRGLVSEAYLFTEMGDCVLAGRSTADDAAAMSRLTLWLLIAGAAVFAFGLGMGGWLTARTLRPLEEISSAAGRISAGNLSERIRAGNGQDEIGRLAGVLNSTFSRLEAAFERQKQFTADASHELRTPIAVILSEAQSALARERSGTEYREALESCQDSAQQMRRLTDALLDLARLDGNGAVRRNPVDLADVARTCIDRMLPLARKNGLTIDGELAPAATLGDAGYLEQVLTNLLANAIQYSKPGGSIRVTTHSGAGATTLIVSDSGEGIQPDDLPHIFERFYRADKARERSSGHAGLGLAICKAIVEAHGGVIEATSRPGEGAAFTVQLPG